VQLDDALANYQKPLGIILTIRKPATTSERLSFKRTIGFGYNAVSGGLTIEAGFYSPAQDNLAKVQALVRQPEGSN
jgi:hypothetical protein